MKKQQNHETEDTMQYDGDALDALNAAGLPVIPILPIIRPVSGLYQWTAPLIPVPPIPIPTRIPPIPVPPIGPGPLGVEDEEAALPLPFPFRREELRLDVDGHFPQKTASGAIFALNAAVMHWIARLTPAGPSIWTGPIWYKDGNTAGFQYTTVTIKVQRGAGIFSWPVSATVTFSGGGQPVLARTFRYVSRYFHRVEFEFDCVQGTPAVLNVDTHAHPDRPATLPNENLTLQKVYQRAGFDVATSSGGNTVPLGGAGANTLWSNQEMHDAMQLYWSRFANKPQWALWTLYAGRHEMGQGLGGIMFDSIGPNHRQGTALFLDSFISQPPAGEPAATRAAWVQRMRFWTAAHEMGHAFNLAHSWQKAMGTPWIPLANEREARSFMNYPYYVAGGVPAFFKSFAYRFSDQELLFMRHAPERFVQMGNANWFDHHGFQRDRVSEQPRFRLDLVPPRGDAKFDFLEPVVLDLRLTNVSDGPQLIDGKILGESEHLTVIIKKHGRPARQHTPFARLCWEHAETVVAPGKSIQDSIFLSAGLNGWDIAEPGCYTIQVALHLDEEDIISDPLTLQVGRPDDYEQDKLASVYFTEDVGRVLAFDGTGHLTGARATLRELVDSCPDTRAAIHARVALGSPLARAGVRLDLGQSSETCIQCASDLQGRLVQTSADEKQARTDLKLLVEDKQRALHSLGETDYRYYLDRFQDLLGSDAKRILRDLDDSDDTRPEATAPRFKSAGPAKGGKRGKKGIPA